jgi:hypothetical protein
MLPMNKFGFLRKHPCLRSASLPQGRGARFARWWLLALGASLFIHLVSAAPGADLPTLFYLRFGAGEVKMYLPLVVLQQSNSPCLARFAANRPDSMSPSEAEAAWIAALGERGKEIPVLSIAQLNALKLGVFIDRSGEEYQLKGNLSLADTLKEGWQISLKPPPGLTGPGSAESDFGPFYLSREPQGGQRRIYLKVPDLRTVEALFKNIQVVNPWVDTNAAIYSLDDALLKRCAIPARRKYAIVRCSDLPPDYILVYGAPLVDKVSASKRLLINASRFNVADAESMDFSVQAAFGHAEGAGEFVNVNANDFERLASIALDARNPNRASRDNRSAWTASLKYNFAAHAILGENEPARALRFRSGQQRSGDISRHGVRFAQGGGDLLGYEPVGSVGDASRLAEEILEARR